MKLIKRITGVIILASIMGLIFAVQVDKHGFWDALGGFITGAVFMALVYWSFTLIFPFDETK